MVNEDGAITRDHANMNGCDHDDNNDIDNENNNTSKNDIEYENIIN